MARVFVYSSLNSLEALEGTCDQRRLWSDCADAQADLSLCWLHKSYCGFCRALAYLTIIFGPKHVMWTAIRITSTLWYPVCTHTICFDARIIKYPKRKNRTLNWPFFRGLVGITVHPSGTQRLNSRFDVVQRCVPAGCGLSAPAISASSLKSHHENTPV